MRKLKYLLVILLLYSCTPTPNIDVKLPNGSVINAKEYWDREYKIGDTVCIFYSQVNSLWFVNNYGVMSDSIVKVNNSEFISKIGKVLRTK